MNDEARVIVAIFIGVVSVTMVAITIFVGRVADSLAGIEKVLLTIAKQKAAQLDRDEQKRQGWEDEGERWRD